MARKEDLINFQIRQCSEWGRWVHTGSSEGAATHSEVMGHKGGMEAR